MPVEKSAGAVVFYRGKGGKIEYLLLEHRAGHWGFPKGLIEKGEKLEEAALRECREETGLEELKLIPGFKETIRYFFKVKYDYQIKERGYKMGQTMLKFVTYFLADAADKKVTLSFEHENFSWFDYNEAAEKLKKMQGIAGVLKNADEFLGQHFLSSFTTFRMTGRQMTEFEKKAYSIVKKIPRGQVLTYRQVAIKLGNAGLARAVGNALNKNTLKNVPCHRVIRSDGYIGGYVYGTANKMAILKKEGVKIRYSKIL